MRQNLFCLLILSSLTIILIALPQLAMAEVVIITNGKNNDLKIIGKESAEKDVINNLINANNRNSKSQNNLSGRDPRIKSNQPTANQQLREDEIKKIVEITLEKQKLEEQKKKETIKTIEKKSDSSSVNNSENQFGKTGGLGNVGGIAKTSTFQSQ